VDDEQISRIRFDAKVTSADTVASFIAFNNSQQAGKLAHTLDSTTALYVHHGSRKDFPNNTTSRWFQAPVNIVLNIGQV
jgi:hypothetical protein